MRSVGAVKSQGAARVCTDTLGPLGQRERDDLAIDSKLLCPSSCWFRTTQCRLVLMHKVPAEHARRVQNGHFGLARSEVDRDRLALRVVGEYVGQWVGWIGFFRYVWFVRVKRQGKSLNLKGSVRLCCRRGSRAEAGGADHSQYYEKRCIACMSHKQDSTPCWFESRTKCRVFTEWLPQ